MEGCRELTPAKTALSVACCGLEDCEGGHQYGPAIRNCHLVHYIFSGCGEFISQGHVYRLHAGQGFVIFPGEVTTYRADRADPWQYGWIGYAGDSAAALTRQAGLTREEPVFACEGAAEIKEILSAVCRDVSTLRMGEISALGGLLRFLSRVGDARHASDEIGCASPMYQYYQKATWYIRGNLEKRLRVGDVASFVGLCRSQLFRVFRATAGCSPQEWIARTRVQRVEELLRDGSLNMNEIALSAGYSSAAQMGEAFKRHRGVAPSAYRRVGRASDGAL